MSPPRPRTVTLASVYAIFAGAFLLFVCLNLASNWTSLEVRQQLEDTFAQIPAAADFDVDDFLPLLRWVATAGAVISLAAIVFGIFVMRGHRGARVGLTVLCAVGMVVFVSGGFAGLLPAMLAAIVLTLLWSAPSRLWFAAVNNSEPLALGANPAVREQRPDLQSPADRGHAADQPPELTAPAWPTAPAATVSHRPTSDDATTPMPRALVVALAIIGVGSVLVLAVTSVLLFALVVLRDQMLEAMRTQEALREQVAASGYSESALLTLVLVVSAIWWVTSLVGVVAIGFAFTRKPFAWWLLMLASVLTVGVSILAFPVGLLVVAAAVLVLLQLSRAEVRAWFRTGSRASGKAGPVA